MCVCVLVGLTGCITVLGPCLGLLLCSFSRALWSLTSTCVNCQQQLLRGCPTNGTFQSHYSKDTTANTYPTPNEKASIAQEVVVLFEAAHFLTRQSAACDTQRKINCLLPPTHLPFFAASLGFKQHQQQKIPNKMICVFERISCFISLRKSWNEWGNFKKQSANIKRETRRMAAKVDVT